ncbi:ShlB/FhaC/HecB family hemolysin secretion/activation protein [Vagococcus sp. WN89Y]|uniref:ShlB/FhaC/HecB family hemolysin secretion/activation protein n=1 Tax=Vagococcus sp. WN89Y TaxID=3457258 RepID=UPI003FCD5249
MKRPFCLAVLCVALLPVVRAETLPSIVDKDNPAKPSRNIPDPNATPARAPTVTVDKPDSELTPQTRVQVRHIQFIGGTVYPLKSLLLPFAPWAGKTVPLQTIIELTNAITARYQKDGYPLSYAWLPDDNFHDGTVKIVLVEGYVARSDIKSDNANTAQRLKRLATKVMNEKPLSQNTFDRYSQLMTRTPGSTVDVNAQLPQNIYGAAVMEARATQPHIWDLSSTLDLRKDQNLALVNGSLSNLTRYGDQLGLAAFVPLDSKREKRYFGANYQQFLTDEGLSMQLKGSFYRDMPKGFEPLLTLPGDIRVEARQNTTQYNGGVSFGYPLLLTRQKQISLSGGADYTDKRNDYALQAAGFGQTLALGTQHQHVRYPALEVGINGFRGFDTASLAGSLTLRQGIDGAGADVSPSGLTDLSFTRWKATLDGAWLLAQNWRLATSLEGDWSDNNLPDAEQVNFGAQRFGRGYQDGEASGDYGYGGQLELRYLFMRNNSPWLATVQPYLLADTARSGYNQSGIRKQRLSSVAGGVMLGDNRHYSLTLEAARPTGDLPTDSDKRSWRYSLTVTWNFNNLR